jgi:hypothetical protein
MQEEQISMTGGRLKHIHFVLMLGIFLFIPLLLSYSIYVNLSGTVLLSSDVSFEDPGDEDLSTCQKDFKVFVPTVSSSPLHSWTHFGRGVQFLLISVNIAHSNNACSPLLSESSIFLLCSFSGGA